MTQNREGSWLVATMFALALSACSPAEQPGGDRPAPPVSEAPPVATGVPDPAVARADALLADMQRREAAYKEAERNAPPAPPPLDLNAFEPRPAPSPAPVNEGVTPQSPAAGQASAEPPVSSGPVKDEAWWKDQMRTLQVRFEEDTRLAAAARRQMSDATLRITQDQATAQYNTRLAAVANARAAIERLEEDARRASVPPGWLRQ